MVSLWFEGVEEFYELSATLDKATQAGIGAEVVRRLTRQGQRLSQKYAPVDTGFLRNSITHEFGVGGWGTAVGRWGPEANYGHYVEFGTSRQEAQPYVLPALNDITPTFERAVLALANPLGPPDESGSSGDAMGDPPNSRRPGGGGGG